MEYAVDSDEERVFQNAIEEELACYNGNTNSCVEQQDGAPPTMCGVAITSVGGSSAVTVFPTDNFVSTGLLVRILEEFDSLYQNITVIYLLTCLVSVSRLLLL